MKVEVFFPKYIDISNDEVVILEEEEEYYTEKIDKIYDIHLYLVKPTTYGVFEIHLGWIEAEKIKDLYLNCIERVELVTYRDGYKTLGIYLNFGELLETDKRCCCYE